MIKLLLLFLLTLTSLLANDVRLQNYPQAQEWEKSAQTDADSAYNLGYIYQTRVKDYQKAIELYKLSYRIKKSSDVANNLGAAYKHTKDYQEAIEWYKIAFNCGQIEALYNLASLYDDLKEYKKAIFYYKKAIEKGDKDAPISLALLYKKLNQYDKAIFYFTKAYEMGEIKAAYGLGYLYDVNLHDSKKAILWYKKAAKRGYAKAIINLGKIYHEKNNEVMASAYTIAMINYGYSKKEVMNFLKNTRKVDNETIKKAYFLQKTLDISKHYYDKEFESKMTHR